MKLTDLELKVICDSTQVRTAIKKTELAVKKLSKEIDKLNKLKIVINIERKELSIWNKIRILISDILHK